MFDNAVYPDVVRGLAALRAAGCVMLVVTSKPQPFAERILEHFELTPYFSGIYGSELSGHLSNKADLIAHVLRTEAIQPSRAVMIGDRSYDIVGARHNGVVAVGVLWGYGSREELVDAGADTVVGSMAELTVVVSKRKAALVHAV